MIRRVARQPVDAGHADVHQHHVGPQLDGEGRRPPRRARLADDLDVVLGVEQGLEAGAHEHLVVGDHHADHGRGDSIRRRPGTRPPAAAGRQHPAGRLDPLAHADQPEPPSRRAVGACTGPGRPVVADLDADGGAVTVDGDVGVWRAPDRRGGGCC